MKIDRTDNWRMLVSIVCIHQFLKMQFTRLQNGMRIGLEYVGIRLEQLCDWVQFLFIFICLSLLRCLRPVKEICFSDHLVVLILESRCILTSFNLLLLFFLLEFSESRYTCILYVDLEFVHIFVLPSWSSSLFWFIFSLQSIIVLLCIFLEKHAVILYI